MPRINNTERYPRPLEITGNEVILSSAEAASGKTINLPVKLIKDYILSERGDFNGVVGIDDSPEEGKTTGYWIANEVGVYEQFDNVENIWLTGIITFNGSMFEIKEFVDVSTLQYNNDFDI